MDILFLHSGPFSKRFINMINLLIDLRFFSILRRIPMEMRIAWTIIEVIEIDFGSLMMVNFNFNLLFHWIWVLLTAMWLINFRYFSMIFELICPSLQKSIFDS